MLGYPPPPPPGRPLRPPPPTNSPTSPPTTNTPPLDPHTLSDVVGCQYSNRPPPLPPPPRGLGQAKKTIFFHNPNPQCIPPPEYPPRAHVWGCPPPGVAVHAPPPPHTPAPLRRRRGHRLVRVPDVAQRGPAEARRRGAAAVALLRAPLVVRGPRTPVQGLGRGAAVRHVLPGPGRLQRLPRPLRLGAAGAAGAAPAVAAPAGHGARRVGVRDGADLRGQVCGAGGVAWRLRPAAGRG